MGMNAIETSDLTRDFKTVRAVDRVSMVIPQGAIFGFLGPNGAGKTTMIRLLLGLHEPTDGSARVLGFDTRTESGYIREQTGALLEHTGLYERLSAEHNLEFFGRVYRMPRTERRARIQELLTRLGLWDRRKERVETWSKGMKQKLAVARAIFHRPPLIFLDEPTAGLDPVASAALREDLANLAAHEGITVFLTTHNLAEAERLCTQVGVISRGKLLTVGHPDELRARSGKDRVEIAGSGFSERIIGAVKNRGDVVTAEQNTGRLILTLVPGSKTAPIVNALVGEGVEIEEVRKGAASLEDAFLTLMNEEKETQ
jgi:ABC-2 type transport system ATP-binding protein